MLGLELTSNNSISNSNHSCHTKSPGRLSNNLSADHHHNNVESSHISSNLKFACFVNVAESHKHISSRNTDLVKLSPSIVFRLITKLRTNITSFYSSLVLPSFSVSKLNHESLGSIILFTYNKPSHDDSMRSKTT